MWKKKRNETEFDHLIPVNVPLLLNRQQDGVIFIFVTLGGFRDFYAGAEAVTLEGELVTLSKFKNGSIFRSPGH